MSLTPEQQQVVDRREGPLLVRAGAGTGKTTVLVERFVRAVVDDAVPVEAMLAITFTDKAAAEMRERVRARFLELGRRDDARSAEGASISTIHGFCGRLLRTHALSAGIDPDYHVLDGLEAERVAVDAFDRALEDFLGPTGGDRLELVASYTPDGVRDMVRTAYSHLRSRGQRFPSLDPTQTPRPAGEPERLEAAARAALAELGAAEGQAAAKAGATLGRCLALLDRLTGERLATPTQLKDLELKKGNAKALSTAIFDEYREAFGAYRNICLDSEQARNHALLRVLLELYGRRYGEAKQARSALDFEDLELLARDLLAGDEGLREQYSARYTHVMVDEFQDVNPLQSQLIGLVARDNLFRVGDENQSIYGFRHADVNVFREHREEAAEQGQALSVTVNFRSRGELIDAVALAFERLWGDDYEPLQEAPGARKPALGEPAVDLLVVDLEKKRWDAAASSRGGGPRRGHGRCDAVAGAGGSAPGKADRRAHRRGALRLPRRGGAPARHHEHGRLRARARGARHPHPRGRRPRVLEPAAGERPAPLARGAGQPAGRAGAVLGAGLTPGRAHARLRGAAGPPRPPGPPGSHVGAPRGDREPGRCARGGAAGGGAGQGAHLPRALRLGARRGASRGTGDADRPRGHADRVRPPPAGRCPPASGAWRTCAS